MANQQGLNLNLAAVIAAPANAAPPGPAAIAPGSDFFRAPNHANQVAPAAELVQLSTKSNRVDTADYSYRSSTVLHEFQIANDADPTKNRVGGLRAGMHFWLELPRPNGTFIVEHLVLRFITGKRLYFDRIDGSHAQTYLGTYSAVGNAAKDLVARFYPQVNLTGTKMRYQWWHVYRHANYTVNPVVHGTYQGNLAEFRRNFCFRNGLASS